MTVNVSSILKIGLVGIINRNNDTNYSVDDISTIRFTKNGITIWMNDEKRFLMKFDMLESIENK